MVSIFDFEDYKGFVKERILSLPKNGHGQYRKIAQFLNMSTVMVSQIFNGEREISVEHGLKLGHFFSLGKLEREYLLTLIQYARAGTHELKQFHLEKMEELREKSKDLSNIVPQDKTLTEEEKAQFYSNWYYSGIRLTTSLENQNNISQLAKRFDLPQELVSEVVDFLVEHGLCLRNDDRLLMGPARIHLEASSPYIRTRQMDWRLKGFEAMAKKTEEDFFFTAPLSVSREGAKEIREKINQFIKEAGDIVTSAPPDQLRCLNIDFFDF